MVSGKSLAAVRTVPAGLIVLAGAMLAERQSAGKADRECAIDRTGLAPRASRFPPSVDSLAWSVRSTRRLVRMLRTRRSLSGL